MRRPTGRRARVHPGLLRCFRATKLRNVGHLCHASRRQRPSAACRADTLPKIGDSYGYGKYAEGILQHRALRDIDGRPILKHMPGLPLLVALTFKTFGSVRPLLVVQVLFLFVSLYFFLLRVRDGFPAAD